MTDSIKLHILNPCSEEYKNFTPSAKGGFCTKCSKEVIDFSSMTDREIIKHFKNSSGKTCGKFKSQQLQTYYANNDTLLPTRKSWLDAGLIGFSLLTLLSNSKLLAQQTPPKTTQEQTQNVALPDVNAVEKDTVTRLISGIVLNNDGESLPFVNVMVSGETPQFLFTDIDGKFEFRINTEETAVIHFQYMGFRTTTVTVKPKGSARLEVTLVEELGELMGEVSVNEVYASKHTVWRKVKGIFR